MTSLLLTMTGTVMAQGNQSVVEQALLQQTNQQRAIAGLPPLLPDESLSQAARQHAQEMAELGYMAHESPRAEHRTLALRLNLTGAIVQAAGENLALLSGVDDIASAAVEGWMDSPGHRQNLLGDFTHVGFGLAASERGTTYVVQVLGARTVDITSAVVSRSLEQVYVLDLGFTLSSPREVAFWLGEDVHVPGLYGPGSHVFNAELRNPGLVHVNSATRPTGSAEDDVFIAADSGWFDAADGTWSPAAGASTGTLRIDRAQGGRVARDVLVVQLAFASPPAGRLGVWLGDEWLRDPQWNGQTLTISLPTTAVGESLRVGVEEGGAGVYSIVASFEIRVGPGGVPELLVRNPGS